MTPAVRPPASITPEQGILIIEGMVKDMETCPALLKSEFGKDVRRKALDIKRHLQKGGFFSERAEKAINNWNKAVLRWVRPDDTVVQ